MIKHGLLIPLLLCLLFPQASSADTLMLPSESVAAMLLGGPPRCLVSPGGRYSWENGELEPLEGLFSFHTRGQQALQARYTISESAARGEVFRGSFLFNEPIDRLDIAMQSEAEGSSVKIRGFPLDESGLRWCFLLGIASTAEAGSYSLQVRASRGRRFLLYLDNVEVRHRSFAREQIAFNQALSELLTVPDERKIEEYRELGKMLVSFHARSVFHTGTLALPVESKRRTSLFADRRLYSYTDGGSSHSLHNGIDLAAPTGTPVFASAAGRVTMARPRIISGNSVVIEHLPGVFTLYFHLEDIEVREGQRVHQGQRIATVGMTGLATGPHLHWELRIGGVAVDPDYLVANPMIDKTLF